MLESQRPTAETYIYIGIESSAVTRLGDTLSNRHGMSILVSITLPSARNFPGGNASHSSRDVLLADFSLISPASYYRRPSAHGRSTRPPARLQLCTMWYEDGHRVCLFRWENSPATLASCAIKPILRACFESWGLDEAQTGRIILGHFPANRSGEALSSYQVRKVEGCRRTSELR